MATSQYGNYSPQAIDPFPIESVLAPLAAGGSQAEAQNLLSHYQLKNMISEDNYNAQLAQQHQFAYDQLHQQMADNYAKNAHSFLTDPNGLSFLRANPQLRYLLGDDQGADQAGISGIIGRQNAKQAAATLKDYMEAALAGGNAGQQIPSSELSATTGYNIQDTTPITVQAAAARGANQRPEHFNMPVNVGVDSGGKDVVVPVAIPFGASQAEQDARVRDAVTATVGSTPGIRVHPHIQRLLNSPGGGASGGGGGGGGGGSVGTAGAGSPRVDTQGNVSGDTSNNPLLGPMAPTGGLNAPTPPPAPQVAQGQGRIPGLPPAPRDTPAGGAQAAPLQTPVTPAPSSAPQTAEGRPASNQQVLDGKAQAVARMATRMMSPEAKMDIAKTLSQNGGNLLLFPAQGGGMVIQGASGKYYTLQ